ncbi:MAG: HEPN domain-containing protein [Candidatus Thermoplasmatota archaeon]
MARIDIERARKLLRSAERLFELGDLHGVAGLAYQAFESGIVSLIKIKNGIDQKSHGGRRKRAKELLSKFRDRIDDLWEYRNIDFYGNISMGNEKRGITSQEAKESLDIVKRIIDEIEQFVGEDQ